MVLIAAVAVGGGAVADAVAIIAVDEHITAQITIIMLSKPMEVPIVLLV